MPGTDASNVATPGTAAASRMPAPASASAPPRAHRADPVPHDDIDFDWTTSATCTIPSGAQVGSCSNAAWHACTVAADCVLAEQICPPGVSDDSSCYHEYVVPLAQLNSTMLPGQLAVHPDGSVWYADFLGGHLGRLDPSTGVTTRFILAPRPDGQALIIPWEVHVASNGDVWATVSASSRLVRVPLANQDDDCDTLVDTVGLTDCQPDANGLRSTTCRNPCVEEFAVPGAWRQQANGTWVSEIASYWMELAADGRVYFDHGYMLPNRQWVFWPQVAEIFPSPIRPPTHNGAKAVHATADGTVWQSDFAGSRLMRLTPRS